jgi:hypothetical protein
MSNVIIFPGAQQKPKSGSLIFPGNADYRPEDILANNPIEPEVDENGVPNYTGRLLALNPEKATRFQCGGFFLGGRLQSSVVPDNAQMYAIQRAIQTGMLLDITHSSEVRTENSTLGGIEESATEKKVYFTSNEHGERIMLATSDPEEQRRLDAQLEAGSKKLILPEGFFDADRYAIKAFVESEIREAELEKESAAKTPRSLKARVKDRLYRLVQAL